MAFEQEVIEMKKEIKELKNESWEQLHYEKMLALKWKMIAIMLAMVALVSNGIWFYVWNLYEYEEEIISEDVITTITQDGENNNMEGVDINGTTNYNY